MNPLYISVALLSVSCERSGDLSVHALQVSCWYATVCTHTHMLHNFLVSLNALTPQTRIWTLGVGVK